MTTWSARTIAACALSTIAPLAVGAAWALPADPPPSVAVPADHSTYEETSNAKKHYVSFFVRGGHPKNSDAVHPITILVNEAYAVGFVPSRLRFLLFQQLLPQTYTELTHPGPSETLRLLYATPFALRGSRRTAMRGFVWLSCHAHPRAQSA